MANVRTIALTPAFQRYYVPNVVDGFRMAITASAAVDMPNEIFAYRVEPVQPATELNAPTPARAIFSHVCSPVDLEEFPDTGPYSNSEPPWFRLATVDIVFRTRDAAIESYEKIQQDVESLILSLNKMDDMVTAAPVSIGPYL